MLGRLGFATAALDAKLLTQHALGLDALALTMRETEPVDGAGAARVAELLQRRTTGESVARIIGEREFYGMAFTLNAATLEPRPDTELLVDLALGMLPTGGLLLDLGTGTGCIPIAILANRPDATGVAVDLSAEALQAARANADRHGVEKRIEFLLGDWFEPLALSSPHGEPVEPRGRGTTSPFGGEVDRLRSGEGAFLHAKPRPPHPAPAGLSPKGRGEESPTSTFDKLRMRSYDGLLFDLIVSNPPYITSAVVETLAPEVRDFDPRLALDGGPDGLAPYRIIAAEADAWLKPNGHVLVEIGYDQGAAVSALFAVAGFEDVAVHRDLAGLDRVVSARHIQAATAWPAEKRN